MTLATISRTELSRHTRQIVEQARRSGGLIVESGGEEQVAILDVHDYRLLMALAAYRSLTPRETPVRNPLQIPGGLTEGALEANEDLPQQRWNRVITAYLDGEISLGRAALLLGIPRYELIERCNRLNVPLLLGPQHPEDAVAELSTLNA